MSPRRRDIQGLRAVAVLMVVLFHARLPITGGFTGVDVFFVISGFVITGMLNREWVSAQRIRMRHFYLRRFMRLAPALAVMVGTVALLSVVLQSPFGPQQAVATTGLGALLMSANLVIANAAGDYFAVTATQNPLLNTWSLSVEEQFYLVFPTLLVVGWMLARRFGRSARIPLIVIGTVSALSFIVSIIWTMGGELASGLTGFFGGPAVFAFYGPFSRVWEFGIGAGLSLVLSRQWTGPRSHNGRQAAHAYGIVGGLMILGSALFITDAMAFPGFTALIPVVGAGLVLLAGAHEGSYVNRALAVRPMVSLGDWSYSWYLWHWPLIVFAGVLLPGVPLALVIAAIISLGPAYLSYRYVEQPLRGLRPATRRQLAVTVGLTSGVPILLCLGLLLGANTGWAGRFEVAPAVAVTEASGTAADSTSAAAVVVDPISGDGAISADTTSGDLRAAHAAVAADCVNTDIDPSGCRFGPSPAKGTVLVLGDSQAYALADGLINAANALGYDTVVSSRTGCPFLSRTASGANDFPCRPWQKAALKYALASNPAVVVIANRSGGYVHPEIKWRTAATDGGDAASSVSDAAALWQDGLTGVVKPLREAGIPVVIVGAVPEMPEFTDQRSLFSQAFGSKALEVSTAKSVAFRKPALDAELAVADEFPGTVVFDPVPALCGADVCSSAVDGKLRYQDETHLTVDGSLLLSPGLKAVLGKVLTPTIPGRLPSEG